VSLCRQNASTACQVVGDLTHQPFRDATFDAVVCLGVLMYNSLPRIERMLTEAANVLKADGFAVISIPHPSLFLHSSPTRSLEPCWLKYVPLSDEPYDRSQQYVQNYYDVTGRELSVVLWHHPLFVYLNAIAQSGFRVEQVEEPIVRREHLVGVGWGEASGYPAYWVARLAKAGRQCM
jgi:SAM-dependent methyltransferase